MMKKLLLSTLFYLLVSNNFSQAFITTWNTGSAGKDTIITFPGYGTNYKIVWEDMSNPSRKDSVIGNDITAVNVKKRGDYRLYISGGSPAFNKIDFSRIDFVEATKLRTVEQWGNIHWSDMKNAFKNCFYLKSVPNSSPDLSAVNSFSSMFFNCFNFDCDISGWNTVAITTMDTMFYNAAIFNHSLDNWNTTNVTDMNEMFFRAYTFNQPINNWNTANVVNMNYMFEGATAFNQPIGNWNTANVINMRGMFYYAESFNQPIGNWNTTNVIDMNEMFFRAYTFNQPINSWNTANVTNMSEMFSRATLFNQPINNWNTANVKDMSGMFGAATSFNQPINNWNTANVKEMSGMFLGAISFNQNINSWSTMNVEYMNRMFGGATLFNQNISSWDVSNVREMEYMFSEATLFNQDITNWNVSNVSSMQEMFTKASSFNQNIGLWNIQYARRIGLDSSGIDVFNYDSILINWSSKYVDSSVELSAKNLHYCNAKSSRDSLILNHKWIFSGDTISSLPCIIPTHISSFTATPQQNTVLLQWQTSTETNNNYFTVQHSINGKDWGSIATVKGYGTSITIKAYETVDSKPINGINYYRIKQTDFNGRFSYSEIRAVAFTNEIISIYPNPASNVLHIIAGDKASMKMYDAIGKQVLINALSIGNNSISLQHLSQGVYIVVVENNKSIITKKIVKN